MLKGIFGSDTTSLTFLTKLTKSFWEILDLEFDLKNFTRGGKRIESMIEVLHKERFFELQLQNCIEKVFKNK